MFYGPMLLWQLMKLLWPLRLDWDGERFVSAVFLRYSVDVFTGYVSAVEPGTDEGRYPRHHTRFSLDDHEGASRQVDAVNVRPMLTPSHLVSVGWIVRDKKVGNAFYVYDHDAGVGYLEKPKLGQRSTKCGIEWVVKPLPEWFQACVAVTIVGIPVLAAIGLAAQWKVSNFAKREDGLEPLIDRMREQETAVRTAARRRVAVP